MRRRSTTGQTTSSQERGAVLIETVLALGLLLLATGTIVNGLTAGIKASERLEHEAHSMDLAITVLSRIEMGLLPASTQEPRAFGHPFGDWSHEIEIESLPNALAPGADPDRPLARVRVTIRHGELDHELSLSQLVLLRHERQPAPGTRVDPERLKKVRELLTPAAGRKSKEKKDG